MPKRGLILASGSPQRRKLLKELGIPFRIVVPGVDESSTQKRPDRLVSSLALRKARAISDRHPGSLVLGADTIVVHRGNIVLKPLDVKDSQRILRKLNGRWHRVYTGVALIDTAGKAWRGFAVSRVKARKLPEAALDRFVGRHMDKAGGYAVQDKNDPFIEKIVGPLDNVIGLPLDTVKRLLRHASKNASR
jgi:septum formation protein